MNLQCLNTIITDNLAIHIDLTNINSWNLNTGLTSVSLTKWSGAVVDNINLADFGLTEFDNGRTDIMWSGITLTPINNKFTMYRVGENIVQNPTTGETSGITVTTSYDSYQMTGITDTTFGNYFNLDGGYLQGFFKLKDFNYKLLPSRFNNGITIETLLFLRPDSHGIFYMMGTRAEDKYNLYFSGETTTGLTSTTGVTTSFENYLESITETQVTKKGFKLPEDNKMTVYSNVPSINDIKNNVISFELTQDKRLAYKYIDNNGLIVTNSSNEIVTTTGFAIFAIVFTPNDTIDDPALIDCAKQRLGKLIFYVNGRAVWILKDFPEFYFKAINTEKEKQIGVPYSISWGGGSFGLKHSFHYDYQTYGLFTNQNTLYIDNNFTVTNNPIPSECDPLASNDYLSGLSLSADTTSFHYVDNCDLNITHPITTMRIEYTGTTGITTGQTYFIKFVEPVSILPNREYEIDLSLFNGGFFRNIASDGFEITNKVSILVYGTVDVDIISDIEYSYPLTTADYVRLQTIGSHPFPDKQEYQYMYNGVMYWGVSGLPVFDSNGNEIYYNSDYYSLGDINSQITTGSNAWKTLKSIFRTKDNSGQQFVYIGLLIETSESFNNDLPLFIENFTYTGADILVQDERKNNLTIEQNFDYGFLGGIQKLRVYDKAFNAQEILHNAIMEAKGNTAYNLMVSKGGRIISIN